MSALDPKSFQETQKFPHDRQLLSVAFSPCGEFVCAGTIDQKVLRWNLETAEKTEFEGHGSWVSSLAFDPNGEFLYSVDFWGSLICWRYRETAAKPVWRVDNTHSGFIRDLAISPDGKHIVTAGADGALHAWHSQNGKPIRTFLKEGPEIFSVAFHPGGDGFVSGDQKGTALHWDFASGKEARRFDASVLFTDPYEDGFVDIGGVRRLAFSQDGSRLSCAGMGEATGGTHGGGELTILEFDWKSGKQVRKLSPSGGGYMKAAGYLPGGEIVSGAEGPHGKPYSYLWFWPNGDKEEPLHVLEKVSAARDLDIHPDEPLVALACFEKVGRGGNGRREDEEYNSNEGSVTLFAPVKPEAPA